MSEQRLLRSVQRLSAALSRLERHTASREGVSVSQLRVLLSLSRDEAHARMRISDLAEEQGLAVSTMTRNVMVLEKKGWVSRHVGDHDRRVVFIQLTEPGRQLAQSLESATRTELFRAFRAFHPSDRVERAVALDRVAAALEGLEQAT